MDTTAVDNLRIGFIGAGRLGTALAWSLARAGLTVACVASTRPNQAAAVTARIDGCAVAAPQETVDRCDLVFITTPDSQIEPVAGALRWRSGMAVVHCSGATEIDVLGCAREQGAWIGGFHPMQAFTDPQAALQSLPGSTITIESEDPLDALLVTIAGRLGCHVNRLPPGMRGRYHAAAGYTSHFMNGVFAEAVRVWASWGASEEDALRALLPLAYGNLKSMESLGIAGGMPGPVARGDVQSVEKHLASLAALGPHGVDFYRTLCARTIPLALEKGSIDEATAERFRDVLDRRG
jgi:predicted short-subunit dehydrogenase-like oxidoreductase (DUF2520 family)